MAEIIDPFKQPADGIVDPFKATPTAVPAQSASVRLADFGRQLAGGSVSAAGLGLRGVAEGAALPGPVRGTPGTRLLARAGDAINRGGHSITDGISQTAAERLAGSTPTGDLMSPSTWSLGTDPTISGYGLQAANVLGQAAPMLATGAITRGRLAPTAAVGATVSGGAAAEEEGGRIRGMGLLDLQKLPGYQERIAAGMSEGEARDDLEASASRGAFLAAAPVGAADAFTHVLPFRRSAQEVLGRIVGDSRIRRGAAGVVLGGAGEGVQEVAEGVAARTGADMVTGDDRNVLDGTFGEFALGSIGGGAIGGIAGLATPNARPAAEQLADTGRDEQQPAPVPVQTQTTVIDPADGPLSRAVATDAAQQAGRAEVAPVVVTTQLADEQQVQDQQRAEQQNPNETRSEPASNPPGSGSVPGAGAITDNGDGSFSVATQTGTSTISGRGAREAAQRLSQGVQQDVAAAETNQPGIPSWIDPDTGEDRRPRGTREQIDAALAARAGSIIDATVMRGIAARLNVKVGEVARARQAMRAAERAQNATPAATAAPTEEARNAQSQEADRSADAVGRSEPAAQQQPAADEPAAQGASQVDAGEEGSTQPPAAAVEAPAAVRPLTYDETPEALDSDISPPSGGSFTSRGAADLAARRTPDARVIPLDDGTFAVRTPTEAPPDADQPDAPAASTVGVPAVDGDAVPREAGQPRSAEVPAPSDTTPAPVVADDVTAVDAATPGDAAVVPDGARGVQPTMPVAGDAAAADAGAAPAEAGAGDAGRAAGREAAGESGGSSARVSVGVVSRADALKELRDAGMSAAAAARAYRDMDKTHNGANLAPGRVSRAVLDAAKPRPPGSDLSAQSEMETRAPNPQTRTAQREADVAAAIERKDADALLSYNIGDRNAAPGARAAFEEATGIKLPPGKKASIAAIDAWAGRDPSARAEAAAPLAKKRKAAEAERVDLGDGPVSGADAIDGLIARGFDTIGKRGTQTHLVNRATGESVRLPKAALSQYARAAIEARALKPKAAPAEAAPATPEQATAQRTAALNALEQVRRRKPRSIAQQFGPNPTDAQRAKHAEQMKAWNRDKRAADTAFKRADSAEAEARRANAQAAAATHRDPGEPAEAATPAVAGEALRKSAINTNASLPEARAALLAQIDAAIEAATIEGQPFGRLSTTSVSKASSQRNEREKEAKSAGHVTFDVPGDGSFRVVNTKARLREFRSTIESSPGFRPKQAAPKGPQAPSLNLSAADRARVMAEAETVDADADTAFKRADASETEARRAPRFRKTEDLTNELRDRARSGSLEADDAVPLLEELNRRLGEAGMDALNSELDRIEEGLPGEIQDAATASEEAERAYTGPGQLTFDNPGGAWETEQQRIAEQRRRDSGLATAQAMIDGKTTAWARGMSMPTNTLAVIPGASAEARVPGDAQFDALMRAVRAEGFRNDSPILVHVNHLGEPYIVEGNTRVAVADALGIPSVPVEIRWMNGGEKAAGRLTPDVLREQAVEVAPTTEPLGPVEPPAVSSSNSVQSSIEGPESAIANRLRKIADEVENQATNGGKRSIDAKWAEAAIKRRIQSDSVFAGRQVGRAASAKVAAAKAKSPAELRVVAEKLSPKVEPPVETVVATENNADAGEELAYNRRNLTGKNLTWDDIADQNATLRAKQTVKSKVWPRPDYEKLVQDGMHPLTARLVKDVYDALAAKPKRTDDASLQAYIAGMGKVRDAVMAWAPTVDMDAVMATLAGAQDMIGFSRAREAIDGALKTGDLREAIFPSGGDPRTRYRGGPNSVANNALFNTVSNARRLNDALSPSPTALRDAMKAVRDGWPAPQEAWEKSYTIHATPAGTRIVERGEARTTTTDEYFITQKGRRSIVGGPFTSRDAAVIAARDLAAGRRKKTGGLAEEAIELRKAVRDGAPRRAPSENVTSERVMETFGIRGVNFGNWMKGEGRALNEERQLHLNHIYDALTDLSEVMNIPAKAIGLDGMLGIAVGAQGSGGKGAGAAHFIPGVNEINITRRTGVGSLAHEWGHALDHYFAVQAGEQVARSRTPFLTEHTQAGSRLDGVRPEIAQAFRRIVDAMNRRPETDAERATREKVRDARDTKRLDSWLTHIAKSIERVPEAQREVVRTEAEQLFDRLRAGDMGEGYVNLGKSRNRLVHPVVEQLRVLFKQNGVTLPPDDLQSVEANANMIRIGNETARGEREPRGPMTRPTDFVENAKALDAAQGGQAYWNTNLELFARAFQSYVLDRLAERGIRSDYLTRPQGSPESIAKLVELKMIAGDRYPRGVEREAMNAAFDTLVGEIRTRTGDDGRVGLFSLPDSAQTQTPAFRRWFGESKVVDANGAPLVVYHGTTADFTEFNPASSSRTGHPASALGVYFTASPRIADRFSRDMRNASDFTDPARQPFANGANTVPAYMAIKNPKVYSDAEFRALFVDDNYRVRDAAGFKAIRAELIEQGYDGIIVEKSPSTIPPPGLEEYGARQFIAFKATQIKSATGNSGAFDPSNPSILASRAEPGRPAADANYMVPPDELRAHVSKIVGKWKGDIPAIRVVDSASELPAFARREQGWEQAEGFYDGTGTVYLVATNIANLTRAEQVLAHEAFGHYGVEGVVGKAQWTKIVGDVARLRKNPSAMKGDMQAAMASAERRYGGQNSATFAREFLAVMAERGVRSSFLGRVLSAVRGWLRTMGFDVSRWADASLREVVAKGMRQVRERGNARADSGRGGAMSAANPTFYSAMTEAVAEAKGAPRKASAEQWGQWLDGAARRGEFKQEERIWSGVDDWMRGQTNITREQLLDYVRANEVQIEETVLGEDRTSSVQDRIDQINDEFNALIEEHGPLPGMDPSVRARADALLAEHDRLADNEMPEARDASQPVKFANYTLPGGQNYRELLLTLPTDEARLRAEGDRISRLSNPTPEEIETFRRANTAGGKVYRSSHFEQANILAHVRFNERTDASGARVLFLEEVQSDWHQEGRKHGYGDKLIDGKDHAYWARRAMELRGGDLVAYQQAAANRDELQGRNAGVPDAPFKTTWPMLAMKRMIRYAVDNGFDRIAWTTGEQQAARYDLSQQVSTIDVSEAGKGRYVTIYPTGGAPISLFVGDDGIVGSGPAEFSGKPLDSVVGKEIADRIVGAKGNKRLEGVDLAIGGDGMKAFYDRMLPAEVNKLAKRYGARVGETMIAKDFRFVYDEETRNMMREQDRGAQEVAVHSLDITDGMRTVAREGLPMFSRPDTLLHTIGSAMRDGDDGLVARLKGKVEDFKPSLLGALTLRQLAEVTERYLPAGRQYVDTQTQMAARRNLLQQEVGDLSQQWEAMQARDRRKATAEQKKNRDTDSDRTVDVMHDATIAGTDPAEAYQVSMIRLNHNGEAVSLDAASGEAAVARLDAMLGSKAWRDSAGEATVKTVRADRARIKAGMETERERAAAYPKLVRQFNRLPPEWQQLYRDVRDAYAKRADQMLDALVARIEALEIDSRQKKALTERVRTNFESARVEAPYFPLARFGDFWAALERTENGETVKQFVMGETQRERDRALRAAEAAGWKVTSKGRKIENVRSQDGTSGTFVSEVIDSLRGHGVREAALDEVYQLYLRTLPDLSTRKHFIHRKKIAGYDQDALRAFSGHMFHGAHQLSKIEFQPRLEKDINALVKQAQALQNSADPDADRASAGVNEFKKRHEWVLNPTNAKWAQQLSSLNFVFYLGLTPAAAAVNLSQTAITTYPVLASRYGAMKALGMTVEAVKQAANRAIRDTGGALGAFKSGRAYDQEKTLGLVAKTPDERRAYADLLAMGAIDVTQSHDLAGLGDTDTRDYNPTVHRAMNVISYLFHKAEVINREASGLANYRMAREAGKSHEVAVKEAAETIWLTHFDYCVDTETEALTTRGWLRHDEIRIGDTIIGIDEAGRATETLVREVNVFAGKKQVIEFGSSRRFSMALTPEHEAVIQTYDSKTGKWSATKKVQARDLRNSHHVMRAPLAPIDRRDGRFGTDFAALLGWIAAEGWYAKFRNCDHKSDVRVSQSISHNPDHVETIRGILSRIGTVYSEQKPAANGTITWTIGGDLRKQILAAMPDKLLTFDLFAQMTAEEMAAVLDAFAKGDGSARQNGAYTIDQAPHNTQNLQVLQAMATALGRTATIDRSGRQMVLAPTIGKITQRSIVKSMTRREIEVDTVWCPTTDSGTWIARRHGAVFVTGNSNANRARFMQGNTAKVLLAFRQYSQSMTFFLWRSFYKSYYQDIKEGAKAVGLGGKGAEFSKEERRQARNMLNGALGMTGIFAGVMGMPLLSLMFGVANAAHAAFGDDDDPWDAEVEFRNFLVDMFGQKLGRMVDEGLIEGGLSAIGISPPEIGSRVSLNDLWVREPDKDLEGKDLYMHLLEQVAGPIAGIAGGAITGAGMIAEGLDIGNPDMAWRGVEKMMPKVVRDGMRAMRYQTQGITNMRGDPLVEDAGVLESVYQGMGFMPADVSRQYEVNAAAKMYEGRINERKQRLLNAYALAVKQGDTEAARETVQKIAAFNKSHPAIAINANSIRRSLQSRQRYSERAVNGVVIGKNLQGEVNDRVRFGRDDAE